MIFKQFYKLKNIFMKKQKTVISYYLSFCVSHILILGIYFAANYFKVANEIYLFIIAILFAALLVAFYFAINYVFSKRKYFEVNTNEIMENIEMLKRQVTRLISEDYSEEKKKYLNELLGNIEGKIIMLKNYKT